MPPVFGLTCCPSAFVAESELSHNAEAHHGLVPKLGHHGGKNHRFLRSVGAQAFRGVSRIVFQRNVVERCFCFQRTQDAPRQSSSNLSSSNSVATRQNASMLAFALAAPSLDSALGFHCFCSYDVFSCEATRGGVRAGARARS